MLLNSSQIYKRCTNGTPLIDPFIPEKISELNGKRCLSFGLQGSGYDVRLAKVYTYKDDDLKYVDPKLNHDLRVISSFTDKNGAEAVILYPGEHYLGVTVESFSIPLNLRGTCEGKSTYARAGLLVPVTPLEPGWGLHERQFLTLELSVLHQYPVKVYLNEGIIQINFSEIEPLFEAYDGHYTRQTEQRAYTGIGSLEV